MNIVIPKLESKPTSLKKYINWAKLTEQNWHIFLSFWENERRKSQIFNTQATSWQAMWKSVKVKQKMFVIFCFLRKNLLLLKKKDFYHYSNIVVSIQLHVRIVSISYKCNELHRSYYSHWGENISEIAFLFLFIFLGMAEFLLS